jgi:hypothetical protein
MKKTNINTLVANLVSATARRLWLGRRSTRMVLSLLLVGLGAATTLSAAAPTIDESSSLFTGPSYPNQLTGLSGTGLTGTTGVTLNGVPVLFELINSTGTFINIWVPYPETETSLDGPLQILHPNGNLTSTASANVTLSQVQTTPTPVVTFARLDSGYVVVITGVNLQLVTGIKIDGAAAAFSKLHPNASASVNLAGTATRLVVPVTSFTDIAGKVLSYQVSSGTAPSNVTLNPTTVSNLALLNGIAPGNVGQMDASKFAIADCGLTEVRITSATAITNTRYAHSDPVYTNTFYFNTGGTGANSSKIISLLTGYRKTQDWTFIAANTLEARGEFTGSAGNTIEFIVTASLASGAQSLQYKWQFNASTGTLGTIKIFQHLDEDIGLNYHNDFFTYTGSVAGRNLQLFVMDTAWLVGVGFSAPAVTTPGALENASYLGFAAAGLQHSWEQRQGNNAGI